MHKTTFAGLTELDPGDPFTVDGSSFSQRNPSAIDFLLRIGAVTHRHDAHASLPDPAGTPVGSGLNSGGQVPASTTLFAAYTLTDLDGGETRRSGALQLSTPNVPNGPSGAITATYDSSGGSLPVGQYAYALTLNDAGGGESVLGPAAFVQRESGFASGQVQLANLDADLSATFVSWNLWRTQDGGDFQVIGTGATDTFTDTGLICTDASRTPPSDMTSVLATNSFTFTLPDGSSDATIAGSGASISMISLYLSPDGSFANPCLYARYPLASGGATVNVTALTLAQGAPPSVSLSIPGAQKIDPDADMIDFPWKRPVATESDLPTTGNEAGDIREAIDSRTAYAWDGSAWGPVGTVAAIEVEGDSGFDTPGVSKLVFTGSGVTLTDDGSGQVTVSITPEVTAARATAHAGFTSAGGWNKIPIDTVATGNDPGSHMDLANNRYTAPSDGVYQVNSGVNFVGGGAGSLCVAAIYVNGVEWSQGTSSYNESGGAEIASTDADLVFATAGDEIEVWAYTSGAFDMSVDLCFLAVVKVG